ncbi:hypothetical protein BG005_007568 [Podila minutissima]|nr:hypothetical protein BG005_007568 [Podila minutissima]
MSVLQQHCSTLEKLAISEITILFDLLASCPRLQVLKSYGPVERWPGKPVAFITVQQLIDWDEDTDEYRPWPCEGTLQTLNIILAGLNPNENEWVLHSKLYGRLARLTQLRELRVEVVKEPQMKGLAMSLEFGLAQLSGLKKMEVLNMCVFTHCPKRKDLEWMVKNWPRLRQIQGLEYKEDKWFRNHLEHMNL